MRAADGSAGPPTTAATGSSASAKFTAPSLCRISSLSSPPTTM
ncbi:Uncharacterised protein [Mycobacteroides abscessus subsp. abscessus]|nr:Uncharacterised protein [Mycobacteroides abscessus subsp. abscessus]SKW35545.1 Uncharacterised protein [Mycobacteroides abscessus subsp. abscessus]